MKAWHIQDKNGGYQQLIFAEKRHEAICKSEAIGWVNYIDVRAKRAKYADDLEKEPVTLVESQLNNGWWFECHGKCSTTLTVEDTYTIADGYIFCENCSN